PPPHKTSNPSNNPTRSRWTNSLQRIHTSEHAAKRHRGRPPLGSTAHRQPLHMDPQTHRNHTRYTILSTKRPKSRDSQPHPTQPTSTQKPRNRTSNNIQRTRTRKKGNRNNPNTRVPQHLPRPIRKKHRTCKNQRNSPPVHDKPKPTRRRRHKPRTYNTQIPSRQNGYRTQRSTSWQVRGVRGGSPATSITAHRSILRRKSTKTADQPQTHGENTS